MSTIIVTHGQAENWHQVRPAGVFRGPGSFTGKFTQPKSAGAAILNMLRPGAARMYANQVSYCHSYSMSTEWMSCGINIFLTV